MHHSVEKIISKQNDYKVCWKCCSVNWYENIHCVECDSTEFHPFHESTAKELQETFADDLTVELNV